MASVFYIAFHYPPVLGSSGVHRTLAFTRHLAANGWHVRVLAPSLAAYDNWSESQLGLIPNNVQVIRAFARNVARHFSWRGKYVMAMAIPDNWQSWIPGGVAAGLWSILKRRPDYIVSTYPIASAHLIAYVLHRLTGVPWIADLRDPMAQENYPADRARRRCFQWLERKIVAHCRFALVTAPGAKELYMQRFPASDPDFWRVLPNGYDEEIFSGVRAGSGERAAGEPFVVLHSGVIYPYERDPTQFFQALSELRRDPGSGIERLHFRLRASGHEEQFREQVAQLDIAPLVSFEPPVPYAEALSEMLSVDGLMLLQADNCNYQIPAKAYEYIRSGKPVLALTPDDGDTGRLMAATGMADICPLDDKDRIKSALLAFLEKLEGQGHRPLDAEQVEQYSRQHQAAQFQALLESALAS